MGELDGFATFITMFVALIGTLQFVWYTVRIVRNGWSHKDHQWGDTVDEFGNNVIIDQSQSVGSKFIMWCFLVGPLWLAAVYTLVS